MDYSACEEESDDEQRGSPHVDIDLLAPTSKLYRGDVTGKSHGGSSKSSYSSSSKYEGGQKEKGSAEAPASGTQPKMPAGPPSGGGRGNKPSSSESSNYIVSTSDPEVVTSELGVLLGRS